MNSFMKYSTAFILIAMLVLFLLSLAPLSNSKIFSNIFVQSYAPRKIMIIERNPIRIVMVGEFPVEDNGLNIEPFDANQSLTHVRGNFMIRIIEELRKMNSEPKYPLNSETVINVDSKLTGDRNRGTSNSAILSVNKDGNVKQTKIEGEQQ